MREAILSVARTFLERHPDEGVADIVSPDLAECERIVRAIPRNHRIVGYHADIRSLALVEADEHAAVCLCDARLRTEILEGARTFPSVSQVTIAGRIDLVSTPDGWRVADYPRHGVPVRSTFRLYRDQSFSRGDFTIVPRLLLLQQRDVHLVFDLRNGSPGTAHVLGGELRARRRLRTRAVRGYARGASHIEAGTTGVVDLGWLVKPHRVLVPLSFEIVAASEAAEAVHLDFRLPSVDSDDSCSQPSSLALALDSRPARSRRL